MYYEIEITRTAKNHLKEEKSCSFDHETITRPSLAAVKEYLIEQYGKLPGMRNKVYYDTVSGETKLVGFTHSFWNKDWSHNSKSWFQTDWISIHEMTANPIDLKLLR